MTLTDFANIISGLGLPWAYYQFETEDDGTPPTPPYIVYFYPASDDVYADGENYQTINRTMVELYTRTKDFETEASVEAAFKAAGLTWAKEATYIDSERLFMTAYDLEVIING